MDRMKRINAETLRALAIFSMLLDHLWATIVPGNQWMHYAGRLAFPIFAFQIVEGFAHTGNFKKYARRLLLFALVSEIPFNLFYSSSWIFPYHQNTIFTLLLGLLAIKAIHTFRLRRSAGTFLLALAGPALACLAAILGMTDYGATGVLTVVTFYLFRDFPYHRIFQLAAMVLLHICFYTGYYIPIQLLGHTLAFPAQGFAVLALIPIWLYSGRKASKSRLLQYSLYLFYPLHLLVLYFLFSFR